MRRPEIKQFIDLRAEDFDRHPIWIGCYTTDYDEPWYDDIDQESFRPWLGETPVSSDDGIFLIRATLEFADGSNFPGFVTPAEGPKQTSVGLRLGLGRLFGDSTADQNARLISEMQPQLFVGPSPPFGFWGGMFGVSPERRQVLFDAVGKNAAEIFPIRFSADKSLANVSMSGQIDGYYRRLDDKVIVE